MVVFVGAVGISVDVGRVVAVHRSAQNSADAVALAMGKDCVARGGLASGGYNRYIRTTPAIGEGQAQSLTDGSCGSGFVTATATETMNYSIAKVFGMTDTLVKRKATARWGQLASGVHLPVHLLELRLSRRLCDGNGTTPGSTHDVVRAGCPPILSPR